MFHASEKICQSIAPPRKHNKFPGSHGINWEKEVRTGKTKYLPVEEALSLLSRLNKKGNPQNIIDSSRIVTTKSMATGTRGSFSMSGAQPSNSFPAKSPLQRLLGSATYTNPQNKFHFLSHTLIDIAYILGFGELKSPGATNESPLMNPTMTHPCDPTLAHSWKGSFDIKGAPEFAPGMFNNCIQAYPPSKVRSEIYTALVEFLRNKDLVMRMLINNVELLLINISLIRMNTTRAI
ncbi:hypothetical protein FXO38_18130 [Capsicum annuum]|uniref:Uncharacterized protein n=1 Tax=Capsicum annuum TaxID=4072 RepID=A0A2G3A1X5_CAPAN|nr:hypothetical protein FXO38_18130 [Capsicum annuum]PHT88243.1 hypothetical protein T459_10349 [Capsicum annuum]